MTAANIIITATNDDFFPIAMDLIQSLLFFREEAGPYDIGVLDVGLSDENWLKLEALGVTVKKAEVDVEYPGREAWEAKRPYIRAMSARPFLPRYFPGYRLYGWMDADTWLQTPDFVKNAFALAAKNPKLHIVSEIDRDYAILFRGAELWEIYADWYRNLFPQDIFNQMLMRPMLNVGIFILPAEDPMWGVWQETYAALMQGAKELTPYYHMGEQLCLNKAIYLQGLSYELLPTEYNWLCILRLPVLDTARNLFVRPSFPHTPLSVLHMTGETKRKPHKIKTLDGRESERWLMRSAFLAGM